MLVTIVELSLCSVRIKKAGEDTDGLKKEDGEYVNEAHGKSPTSIRLIVHGGIGAIHLIEER